MIKVADYIMQRLVEKHGVKDIFMISGGGAMHLNDAIGKCEGLNYICNHNEQATAIAVEGYARVTGKIGVANVTTGPGGANAIGGLISSWLDSIPALFISGQVKLETCLANYENIGLRQIGDQEINIIDMVKPVTKYAEIIKEPKQIKKMLDKAIYLATHGRKGPVWLDIPLDIQGAMIDESELAEYDEQEDKKEINQQYLESKVAEVIKELKQAKRPVLVAGHGIRLANAQKEFLQVVEKLGLPVISTFNGFDLIPTDHPLYVGRMSTIGTRAGNFAAQNSDVYLSVGSRNNVRQISYNWKVVAREATKIIVDIDPLELKKPTLKPDLPINLDAKIFLQELLKQAETADLPAYTDWADWCRVRRDRYPVVLPEYRNNKEDIEPYTFFESLTKQMPEGAIATAGNGTACVCLFQAGIVKKNQHIFWNSGSAAMGYDLPAAIGACVGSDKKDVVCVAGDGSLMMNIQELATVAHNKLPIKIFIMNNDGYISIRQTQANFFDKRWIACDDNSGVGFPDFAKTAAAFGLPYQLINEQSSMEKQIAEVLNTKGPIICEVKLKREYTFSPKLSSKKLPNGKMVSKPLEDLFPFLSREEFLENMIIDPLSEE
ncbi:thiamine pyrophosphate-binding protein [bacterium]|jgi:acetolactate synthase I/II/III large subunit|nr:thiamine pyrophosphate-binding protein [bacterium]MBT3580772.1 thiamine pyrophosphate-binding protein [bacterium]MBT4551623.1 thiamine pyrophosphate-binding protein [bacterium]MBT5988745.1 thiamine pyrophosphate-binding protein [bacterium]MBT7088420.1 thiamine pyrophosphate-binding protein [bacterium]